eukprot:3027981-Amphidinium_carterae.1
MQDSENPREYRSLLMKVSVDYSWGRAWICIALKPTSRVAFTTYALLRILVDFSVCLPSQRNYLVCQWFMGKYYGRIVWHILA